MQHHRTHRAWGMMSAVPLCAKHRGRSCRGQAIIEFAIVCIAFFLLVFALIDFCWLMFSQMNMQNAVLEAGRFAVTGNTLPNPAGGTFDRISSIKKILAQQAEGTNIESVAVSSTIGGVTTTNSAGGPGATETITVYCDVPLLTKSIGWIFGTDNRFHFTVSATFKNEPFQPS